MAEKRPWLLVLVPSLAISFGLWRMPDTAGASPIWTVLIWLLLALASVIAVAIAVAAGRRGKELALFAVWGAASALMLIPFVAVILFTVSLIFGV